MIRVSVPPRMVRWACERAGRDMEDVASRVPQITAWIRGEKRPTLRQLEQLAQAAHTPLGYLFLDDPPDETLPIPDYRVLSSVPERPSPDLLESIYAMQRRKDWLRETLVGDGASPLPFVGSVSLTDEPDAVGREMRRTLGLSEDWAAGVSTWLDAAGELRRRVERLGVMAVINGVVGNNARRPLSVHEFRGFALVDPYAPLIFVNGADAKSAQSFTLAHELAHVWLGREGISGFDDLDPGRSAIEEWCNAAAAELLVPAEALRTLWRDVRDDADCFESLARSFKVSPVVAARRGATWASCAKMSSSGSTKPKSIAELRAAPPAGGAISIAARTLESASSLRRKSSERLWKGGLASRKPTA